MADLLFPELSYKLVGILFKVHRELGSSCQEKYYQRAVEKLLELNKIKYEKELKCDVYIDKEKIGVQILDFLVEDKIILELKAVPILTPEHFRQLRRYLWLKNLELGLLVNFRCQSLIYKRVLNYPNKNHSENSDLIRIN